MTPGVLAFIGAVVWEQVALSRIFCILGLLIDGLSQIRIQVSKQMVLEVFALSMNKKMHYLSPSAQALELAAESFVCQSPVTFILTFDGFDSDEENQW